MGFTGYKDFDSGSGNLIADYLKEWKDKTFGKNATAKPYQTGGGSAGIHHMILVIIINERDETMLQRTLGSGWGVLLPGLLIAGLMYADLSPDQWRIVILMGLILTPVMLYHKQLRHYVLLPSCLALIAAIMLMIMNLNQA